MPRVRKKYSAKSRYRPKKKISFKDYLNNLFLPGKKNRYRPQLLHPETLMVLSFVVLGGFSLFNAIRFFPSLADKILGFASNIDVNRVLVATNEERARLGLEPLQINEKLNQAALAKAQHMFSEQYWAHSSPEGVQPWNFIKNAGYVYKYAGENLARDFDSTGEMMVAWMNSPTHKENVINPNFTQIGLAVVNGTLSGFNTTLVVQMFAAPGAVEFKQSASKESYTLPAPADSSVGEIPTENIEIDVVESDLAKVGELGMVEGERSVSGRILFSPIYLTKTFFLLVVVLIILTLIYDAFISKNRRYQRVVGQNFAHIMLFLTVGFLLILFRGGTIIP
ncbi:MAG: hypothetical protein GX943_01045 [Candidatus Pacebacteria bacterium]|jgi:hypothetical protein|nr:hypothetical protein [Candidatus Paceibacterota bacterium]